MLPSNHSLLPTLSLNLFGEDETDSHPAAPSVCV